MNKNNKKVCLIKFRISENDKNIIEAKAKKLEISISDFIRHALLGYRLRQNNENKKYHLEIARIGSNLNQVARHANTYKYKSDTLYILTELYKIEENLKDISQKMSKGD